jgi:hypothetical protein
VSTVNRRRALKVTLAFVGTAITGSLPDRPQALAASLSSGRSERTTNTMQRSELGSGSRDGRRRPRWVRWGSNGRRLRDWC